MKAKSGLQVLIILAACFGSLGLAAQNKLFSLVSPDSSGVKFSNNIKDDKEINILEYLYFYNGAGVSIGDVNNDGLPDLYFTSNRYGCKLYLNKGNLKFEDVTKKAGVGGYTGAIVTGVVMVGITKKRVRGDFCVIYFFLVVGSSLTVNVIHILFCFFVL